MSSVAEVPSVEVLGLRVADLSCVQLVSNIVGIEPLLHPRVFFAVHIGGLLEVRGGNHLSELMVADIVYCDGISAVVLAKIAGAHHVSRCPTTDLGWEVMRAFHSLHQRRIRVGLVGGRPGLAELAAGRIASSGLAEVVLTDHGFHEDWSATLEEIKSKCPDLLFVGMGAPKEMEWVSAWVSQMPGMRVMTCGGWFGHIVGSERRAPVLVQRMGLEWTYRLVQNPRGLWRRYLRGFVLMPSLVFRVLADRVRLHA